MPEVNAGQVPLVIDSSTIALVLLIIMAVVPLLVTVLMRTTSSDPCERESAGEFIPYVLIASIIFAGLGVGIYTGAQDGQERAGEVVQKVRNEHGVTLVSDIPNSFLRECASKGYSTVDGSWVKESGTGIGKITDGKLFCKEVYTGIYEYSVASY